MAIKQAINQTPPVLPQEPAERRRFFRDLYKRYCSLPKINKEIRQRYAKRYGKPYQAGNITLVARGEMTSAPVLSILLEVLAERESAKRRAA